MWWNESSKVVGYLLTFCEVLNCNYTKVLEAKLSEQRRKMQNQQRSVSEDRNKMQQRQGREKGNTPKSASNTTSKSASNTTPKSAKSREIQRRIDEGVQKRRSGSGGTPTGKWQEISLGSGRSNMGSSEVGSLEALSKDKESMGSGSSGTPRSAQKMEAKFDNWMASFIDCVSLSP